MGKAVLILRILLGALYTWASASFFLGLMPQPELSGNMAMFMGGLMASGYLIPLVKATELVGGLALLSGRFVPLAAVVLFPITLNIFLIHVFMSPADLPVAIFMLVANLVIAYSNKGAYEGLLASK